MSDEKVVVVEQENWANAVAYVCLLILIILCVGEPDLLDAIREWVLSNTR